MNFRGQRVLIFGDSLTHHGADADPPIWDVNVGANRQSSAPGDLLASMIRDAGAAAVRTDARVGRSAHNYWTREEGATLASDVAWKPTRVIVMLGTNDLGLNMNADQVAMTNIRNAFKKLPNVEIIAVGPPTFANQTRTQQAFGVYTMLQDVFGAKNVIDSRPLTSVDDRTTDGVHFTVHGAREFAEGLFTVLQGQAAPPAPNEWSLVQKLLFAALGVGSLVGIGYLTMRVARRYQPKWLLGSSDERPPTIAELEQIGEDALKEGDATGDISRASKIAAEGAALHPDEWYPYDFWSLKSKKDREKWTYPKAHKSIMEDLRANGWKVEAGLKIPHATSPQGNIRLWFKPQTIHMTRPGRGVIHSPKYGSIKTIGPHKFSDARAISYVMDSRWLPGPRFRGWLMQSQFPGVTFLGSPRRRRRRSTR